MYTYVLTANPEYLRAAVDEFKALDRYAHAELEFESIAVMESSLDLQAMFMRLQQRPLVFSRHLHPSEWREILTSSGPDIGALTRAVLRLPSLTMIESGTRFAVQARVVVATGLLRPYSPYAIKYAMVPVIETQTGGVEDVKNPEVVISVLALKDVGFVGISPVEFNLSDWSGGMRRFARTEDQLSRAEFKLLEAFEVFGVTDFPVDGTALDLGAAPGGWTRMLREKGLKVFAVDPADLDPALMNDPLVRSVKGYAQPWVEKLKEQKAKFDIVVSDMRMDARDAARFMVEVAPLLNLNSFAMITLKLPPPGTIGLDPVAIVHQALNELRSRYRTVKARQLFHNRNEVTVFLQL